MTAVLERTTTQTPATATPNIRKMAIIVRDDAFDRLLTPLAFAYEMAKRGTQVDVLCVLWAVRVLSKQGVTQVQLEANHADRKQWLLNRLAELGEPQDLHGFIQAGYTTGRVRFHACAVAAATFGVSEQDLLPEVSGIIHPTTFLNEIAASADHCQYF